MLPRTEGVVAVPAEAVLTGDALGVARALALGTHFVRKHDIVGATSTSPAGF